MQSSIGVVLAGAAALGAYEVGVVGHLIERVLPEVARHVDVVSGTSAGAINAAALAAFADRPELAVRMLAREWGQLELGRILRPSSVELLSMCLDVTGVPHRLRRALAVRAARGGLLDPAPIARVVGRIPFDRLEQQVFAGQIRIAISATQVATGGATVFYAARDAAAWRSPETAGAIATSITAPHVLASSAIPLLFPTVAIAGDLYCDGGLRQMVPLSPAVHLGATRLLVIDPLSPTTPPPPSRGAVTSPLFLAGKALNALFADRVSTDLAHLRRTTAMLRAGRRRFGPSFARELDRQLASDGEPPVREIDAVHVGPTRDVGALAVDYVTGPTFAARATGAPGRLLRWIADGDPERAGDLLAYLLFDGGFTSELMSLGRADARARHDELVALFAHARRSRRDEPAPGSATR